MSTINKIIVIAEIGCNHKGSMGIAKEMIKNASEFCGVDVVKFQKRNSKELLSEEEYNNPHPNPINSYGKTYGEHREFLEFDYSQNEELMNFCKELNVDFSTSVWDLTSAKEIVKLNPKLIKIPSACNLNKELLLYLINNYEGEIHVSFGMTTKSEQEKIVSLFEVNNRNFDLVIYNCTSGYPVEFKDVCLNEIINLKNKFERIVKGIGFSGHHLGIAIDMAAVTLGVKYIERHFTLDRTWKGTDHSASLEPAGMRKLVRDIKATCSALTYKNMDILDVENVQRNKLKSNQIKWD